MNKLLILIVIILSHGIIQAQKELHYSIVLGSNIVKSLDDASLQSLEILENNDYLRIELKPNNLVYFVTKISNDYHIISSNGNRDNFSTLIEISDLGKLEIESQNKFLNSIFSDNNTSDLRPCCSRSDFKAWYNLLKDTDHGPELNVICDVCGCCNLGHYISAAIICCMKGTGPENYDNSIIQRALTDLIHFTYQF